MLAIIGHYLPGSKGGGQVVAASTAIEHLGADFDFRVVCLDRDLGDAAPYPGSTTGAWRRVGNARVCYLERHSLLRWWRHAAVREVAYDLLWIHGLFASSSIATLAHRRLGGAATPPAVIVPHGELSAGALGIRRRKKRAFLALARPAGLYERLWWQASSEQEAGEVTAAFPRVPAQRVRVVRNLTVASPVPVTRRAKQPGTLRLVFLSRISPKKNLDVALRVLSRVDGDIVFDVFGPTEDQAHWTECQALIGRMPGNVRVSYHGPIEQAAALPTLSAYHALFLPTRGENFGYAILEALQAGCLPVISDATPWRRLEQARAGWDIPLSDLSRFEAALRRLVAMDAVEFDEWSASAANLGREAAGDPEPADRLRELFNDALRR